MLFVLPVSAHDINIFGPLVDVIVRFGQMQDHEFLVLPTPEVEAEATRLAHPLHNLCKTRIVPTHENHTGSWPWACNKHFAAGVQEVISSYEGAWMWMEADCCPVVPNWASLLSTEYNLSGKQCLGFIRDTSEVSSVLTGQHLVGAAIYNTRMWLEQKWWQTLVNVQNEPFDVFLRWWLAPISHHSKLYHHAYTSYDYRRTAMGIGYTQAVLNENRRKVREVFGLVPQGTALVHGCKDSSLARLIPGDSKPTTQNNDFMGISKSNAELEDAFRIDFDDKKVVGNASDDQIKAAIASLVARSPFLPIAKPEIVDSVLPKPDNATYNSPEFKAILKELEGWKIEIPALYSGLSAGCSGHAAKILGAIRIAEKQAKEDAPATDSDIELAKKVSRIVNSGEKSIRIDRVAEDLQVEVRQIKSAEKAADGAWKINKFWVAPLRPNTFQARGIAVVEA